MNENVSCLILAAGKGERMRSDLPKVLHSLGGRPLIRYAIENARLLKASNIVVIVGHKAPLVREALKGEKVTFAVQREQLGTAHAVVCGLPALKRSKGLLYILYGDVPLIRPETLRSMKERLVEEEASLVVLTAEMKNPSGYGRIVRDGRGEVSRIVEHKDAEDWEREIHEINSGIYLVRIEDIRSPLRRVRQNIVKGEYYLTSLVEGLLAEGKRVTTLKADDAQEVMGVNTRRELADADAELQRRIRNRWMEAGVTMWSPETIRIDAEARLAPDVVLHAGTVITGKSAIARGAEIFPYSVIEESVVGEGARIGPFAHVRPESHVAAGAHVGNFVELKKTKLGPGAKANHLAYLGDAVIGSRANVGAGTITCNYDGFHKYPTVIGEEAFIGSDTQLVAPVRIGKRAWIAAGTTVTQDVPDGALAVSRIEQRNIPSYDAKRRRKVKRV